MWWPLTWSRYIKQIDKTHIFHELKVACVEWKLLNQEHVYKEHAFWVFQLIETTTPHKTFCFSSLFTASRMGGPAPPPSHPVLRPQEDGKSKNISNILCILSIFGLDQLNKLINHLLHKHFRFRSAGKQKNILRHKFFKFRSAENYKNAYSTNIFSYSWILWQEEAGQRGEDIVSYLSIYSHVKGHPA